MKKSISFGILLIIVFTSCRTLNLAELNPQGKISPLLPALSIEFDMYSLEKNFPDRFNSLASFSSTNMEVTSQNINITNINTVDITPNDLITLFSREVKNNITNPYGEINGTIFCRIAGRDENASYLPRLLSMLSLGTLNILGMPYSVNRTMIDVEIEILNNNNELVGQYNAIGKGKEVSSLYYGHSHSTAKRYANIEAFKAAMTDIKKQIEADHKRLIENLE